MSKGLYFTAVVFSFFFFSTPNLWGHWTDLNQTWTHIQLWLLFEKIRSNFPGIYPTGWGHKTAFWDRLWTLTEHISATEHDINNRKENYQSPWTPLQAPNLMNFGLETAENGWRFFCQIPYIFALGDTASFTAWTLYNRQQANFDTCYVVARAYSLQQQNAGRAHAGLCHASSLFFSSRPAMWFSCCPWLCCRFTYWAVK